jgi:hypothetical protein
VTSDAQIRKVAERFNLGPGYDPIIRAGLDLGGDLISVCLGVSLGRKDLNDPEPPPLISERLRPTPGS